MSDQERIRKDDERRAKIQIIEELIEETRMIIDLEKTTLRRQQRELLRLKMDLSWTSN